MILVVSDIIRYFLLCDFRRKYKTVVKATARVDKFSKTDIIVSPSILSANFAKLGEQVVSILIFTTLCFLLYYNPKG